MRPTPIPRSPRRTLSTRARLGGSALLAGVLLGLAALAGAQEATRTFDDWTLSCGTPQGSDKEMCSAAQVVQNKETEKSLLAAVVGYIPGTQDMAMEFTVPLGVILPAGIRLQVDDSEEIGRAPYLMCTPQGCTGIWKLEDQAVAALKKGLTLKVIVLNSQQRPVAVPVSLRGFTAAYNSLVQKGP